MISSCYQCIYLVGTQIHSFPPERKLFICRLVLVGFPRGGSRSKVGDPKNGNRSEVSKDMLSNYRFAKRLSHVIAIISYRYK